MDGRNGSQNLCGSAGKTEESLATKKMGNGAVEAKKDDVLSKGLKRALEEDGLNGPPSKEAKQSTPPMPSIVDPSTSAPVVQAANGKEWTPEFGKLIPGSAITEDHLAALLKQTGTAPLVPGENSDEPVVTVSQAIKLGELLDKEYAEQLAEEEADDNADVAAVLGDCSDEICSYSKGYVKRQALYSCTTCYKKTQEVAGICLACTYTCHDGHDLVELYTKRNFRCDCGNSKFTGLACKLTPNKDILNEGNQYNQNFLNAYCTCQRPYPDPEAAEEMIQVQCTLCEDWFHLQHVLKNTEDLEARLEIPKSLVCRACREKHPFVNYYVAEEGDLVGEFDHSQPECQIDGCGLKFLQKKFPELPPIDEAGWTPMDWYANICRCDACQKVYADEKVEFLLDNDESVAEYEDRGRAKMELERQETITRVAEIATGGVERALQEVLQGQDRFVQVEFASMFTDMRTSLEEYLQEFRDRDEIVRPEHITAFFELKKKQLEERQQQRGSGSDF